jgi:mono/diheme cytochrome c family protein
MRNVAAFIVALGVAGPGVAGFAEPGFSPVGVISAGQASARQTKPVLADSLAGRDSYELYCASCHGPAGHGDGPVAPALRTHPADLTLLAQHNNGAFPRNRVRDFVAGTGRTPAAHGTTEMPIWGPMFRAFESDARVRQRIENLLTFIESMQQPSPRMPSSRGSQ